MFVAVLFLQCYVTGSTIAKLNENESALGSSASLSELKLIRDLFSKINHGFKAKFTPLTLKVEALTFKFLNRSPVPNRFSKTLNELALKSLQCVLTRTFRLYEAIKLRLTFSTSFCFFTSRKHTHVIGRVFVEAISFVLLFSATFFFFCFGTFVGSRFLFADLTPKQLIDGQDKLKIDVERLMKLHPEVVLDPTPKQKTTTIDSTVKQASHPVTSSVTETFDEQDFKTADSVNAGRVVGEVRTVDNDKNTHKNGNTQKPLASGEGSTHNRTNNDALDLKKTTTEEGATGITLDPGELTHKIDAQQILQWTKEELKTIWEFKAKVFESPSTFRSEVLKFERIKRFIKDQHLSEQSIQRLLVILIKPLARIHHSESKSILEVLKWFQQLKFSKNNPTPTEDYCYTTLKNLMSSYRKKMITFESLCNAILTRISALKISHVNPPQYQTLECFHNRLMKAIEIGFNANDHDYYGGDNDTPEGHYLSNVINILTESNTLKLDPKTEAQTVDWNLLKDWVNLVKVDYSTLEMKNKVFRLYSTLESLLFWLYARKSPSFTALYSIKDPEKLNQSIEKILERTQDSIETGLPSVETPKDVEMNSVIMMNHAYLIKLIQAMNKDHLNSNQPLIKAVLYRNLFDKTQYAKLQNNLKLRLILDPRFEQLKMDFFGYLERLLIYTGKILSNEGDLKLAEALCKTYHGVNFRHVIENLDYEKLDQKESLIRFVSENSFKAPKEDLKRASTLQKLLNDRYEQAYPKEIKQPKSWAQYYNLKKGQEEQPKKIAEYRKYEEKLEGYKTYELYNAYTKHLQWVEYCLKKYAVWRPLLDQLSVTQKVLVKKYLGSMAFSEEPRFQSQVVPYGFSVWDDLAIQTTKNYLKDLDLKDPASFEKLKKAVLTANAKFFVSDLKTEEPLEKKLSPLIKVLSDYVGTDLKKLNMVSEAILYLSFLKENDLELKRDGKFDEAGLSGLTTPLPFSLRRELSLVSKLYCEVFHQNTSVTEEKNQKITLEKSLNQKDDSALRTPNWLFDKTTTFGTSFIEQLDELLHIYRVLDSRKTMRPGWIKWAPLEPSILDDSELFFEKVLQVTDKKDKIVEKELQNDESFYYLTSKVLAQLHRTQKNLTRENLHVIILEAIRQSQFRSKIVIKQFYRGRQKAFLDDMVQIILKKMVQRIELELGPLQRFRLSLQDLQERINGKSKQAELDFNTFLAHLKGKNDSINRSILKKLTQISEKSGIDLDVLKNIKTTDEALRALKDHEMFSKNEFEEHGLELIAQIQMCGALNETVSYLKILKCWINREYRNVTHTLTQLRNFRNVAYQNEKPTQYFKELFFDPNLPETESLNLGMNWLEKSLNSICIGFKKHHQAYEEYKKLKKHLQKSQEYWITPAEQTKMLVRVLNGELKKLIDSNALYSPVSFSGVFKYVVQHPVFWWTWITDLVSTFTSKVSWMNVSKILGYYRTEQSDGTLIKQWYVVLDLFSSAKGVVYSKCAVLFNKDNYGAFAVVIQGVGKVIETVSSAVEKAIFNDKVKFILFMVIAVQSAHRIHTVHGCYLEARKEARDNKLAVQNSQALSFSKKWTKKIRSRADGVLNSIATTAANWSPKKMLKEGLRDATRDYYNKFNLVVFQRAFNRATFVLRFLILLVCYFIKSLCRIHPDQWREEGPCKISDVYRFSTAEHFKTRISQSSRLDGDNFCKLESDLVYLLHSYYHEKNKNRRKSFFLLVITAIAMGGQLLALYGLFWTFSLLAMSLYFMPLMVRIFYSYEDYLVVKEQLHQKRLVNGLRWKHARTMSIMPAVMLFYLTSQIWPFTSFYVALSGFVSITIVLYGGLKIFNFRMIYVVFKKACVRWCLNIAAKIGEDLTSEKILLYVLFDHFLAFSNYYLFLVLNPIFSFGSRKLHAGTFWLYGLINTYKFLMDYGGRIVRYLRTFWLICTLWKMMDQPASPGHSGKNKFSENLFNWFCEREIISPGERQNVIFLRGPSDSSAYQRCILAIQTEKIHRQKVRVGKFLRKIEEMPTSDKATFRLIRCEERSMRPISLTDSTQERTGSTDATEWAGCKRHNAFINQEIQKARTRALKDSPSFLVRVLKVLQSKLPLAAVYDAENRELNEIRASLAMFLDDRESTKKDLEQLYKAGRFHELTQAIQDSKIAIENTTPLQPSRNSKRKKGPVQDVKFNGVDRILEGVKCSLLRNELDTEWFSRYEESWHNALSTNELERSTGDMLSLKVSVGHETFGSKDQEFPMQLAQHLKLMDQFQNKQNQEKTLLWIQKMSNENDQTMQDAMDQLIQNQMLVSKMQQNEGLIQNFKKKSSEVMTAAEEMLSNFKLEAKALAKSAIVDEKAPDVQPPVQLQPIGSSAPPIRANSTDAADLENEEDPAGENEPSSVEPTGEAPLETLSKEWTSVNLGPKADLLCALLNQDCLFFKSSKIRFFALETLFNKTVLKMANQQLTQRIYEQKTAQQSIDVSRAVQPETHRTSTMDTMVEGLVGRLRTNVLTQMNPSIEQRFLELLDRTTPAPEGESTSSAKPAIRYGHANYINEQVLGTSKREPTNENFHNPGICSAQQRWNGGSSYQLSLACLVPTQLEHIKKYQLSHKNSAALPELLKQTYISLSTEQNFFDAGVYDSMDNPLTKETKKWAGPFGLRQLPAYDALRSNVIVSSSNAKKDGFLSEIDLTSMMPLEVSKFHFERITPNDSNVKWEHALRASIEEDVQKPLLEMMKAEKRIESCRTALDSIINQIKTPQMIQLQARIKGLLLFFSIQSKNDPNVLRKGENKKELKKLHQRANTLYNLYHENENYIGNILALAKPTLKEILVRKLDAKAGHLLNGVDEEDPNAPHSCLSLGAIQPILSSLLCMRLGARKMSKQSVQADEKIESYYQRFERILYFKKLLNLWFDDFNEETVRKALRKKQAKAEQLTHLLLKQLPHALMIKHKILTQLVNFCLNLAHEEIDPNVRDMGVVTKLCSIINAEQTYIPREEAVRRFKVNTAKLMKMIPRYAEVLKDVGMKTTVIYDLPLLLNGLSLSNKGIAKYRPLYGNGRRAATLNTPIQYYLQPSVMTSCLGPTTPPLPASTDFRVPGSDNATHVEQLSAFAKLINWILHDAANPLLKKSFDSNAKIEPIVYDCLKEFVATYNARQSESNSSFQRLTFDQFRKKFMEKELTELLDHLDFIYRFNSLLRTKECTPPHMDVRNWVKDGLVLDEIKRLMDPKQGPGLLQQFFCRSLPTDERVKRYQRFRANRLVHRWYELLILLEAYGRKSSFFELIRGAGNEESKTDRKSVLAFDELSSGSKVFFQLDLEEFGADKAYAVDYATPMRELPKDHQFKWGSMLMSIFTEVKPCTDRLCAQIRKNQTKEKTNGKTEPLLPHFIQLCIAHVLNDKLNKALTQDGRVPDSLKTGVLQIRGRLGAVGGHNETTLNSKFKEQNSDFVTANDYFFLKRKSHPLLQALIKDKNQPKDIPEPLSTTLHKLLGNVFDYDPSSTTDYDGDLLQMIQMIKIHMNDAVWVNEYPKIRRWFDRLDLISTSFEQFTHGAKDPSPAQPRHTVHETNIVPSSTQEEIETLQKVSKKKQAELVRLYKDAYNAPEHLDCQRTMLLPWGRSIALGEVLPKKLQGRIWDHPDVGEEVLFHEAKDQHVAHTLSIVHPEPIVFYPNMAKPSEKSKQPFFERTLEQEKTSTLVLKGVLSFFRLIKWKVKQELKSRAAMTAPSIAAAATTENDSVLSPSAPSILAPLPSIATAATTENDSAAVPSIDMVEANDSAAHPTANETGEQIPPVPNESIQTYRWDEPIIDPALAKVIYRRKVPVSFVHMGLKLVPPSEVDTDTLIPLIKVRVRRAHRDSPNADNLDSNKTERNGSIGIGYRIKLVFKVPDNLREIKKMRAHLSETGQQRNPPKSLEEKLSQDALVPFQGLSTVGPASNRAKKSAASSSNSRRSTRTSAASSSNSRRSTRTAPFTNTDSSDDSSSRKPKHGAHDPGQPTSRSAGLRATNRTTSASNHSFADPIFSLVFGRGEN